jgi:nucleoside-diphosphate-sugar epimerase
MRQYADRVVDIEADPNLTQAPGLAGRLPRGRGRRILVTGANGYFGRVLLETLLSSDAIDSVVAMVRKPARFDGGTEPALPAGIEIVDTAALITGGFQMGGVDVICHLASARPHHNAVKLADSLRFTQMLVTQAIRHQIPGFINASSQAVYGTSRPPLWTEELPPAPETAFAQSKWAMELMAASISRLNTASKATSLRFAQLIGPGVLPDPARLAHKYAQAALAGEPLKVLGGRQRLDFVDLRDAAELVSILAVRPFQDWPEALNVGGREPISVLDLANIVANLAERSGLNRPEVQVNPDFAFPDFGMSCEQANKTLGWAPKRSLEQTIMDILINYSGNQWK